MAQFQFAFGNAPPWCQLVARAISGVGVKRTFAVFAYIFALIIASKALLVAVPFFLKGIVESTVSDGHKGAGLIVVYVGAKFISRVVDEYKNLISLPVISEASRHVAIEAHRDLLDKPFIFHLSKQAGGLAKVVERGSDAVFLLFNQIIFQVAPKIAEYILTVLALLVFYDWEIAIRILLGTAAYVAVSIGVARNRVELARDRSSMYRKFSSMMVESFSAIETILALRSQRVLVSRHSELSGRLWRCNVDWERNLVKINVLQAAIVAITVGVSLLYAHNALERRAIGMADFIMINALVLQLMSQLQNVAGVYRFIREAVSDLDALAKTLELDVSRTEAEAQGRPTRSIGIKPSRDICIEVRGASFSYPYGYSAVKNVDLSIRDGDQIAIVGPSGSGKSSLARLIAGLTAPTEGNVHVYGCLMTVQQESSEPPVISFVPQDASLFSGSIEENLRTAKQNATEEEVAAAVCAADLTKVIEKLDRGIDTVLHERGRGLSGGERQRVAIARALLSQPKIIVLDEATSALDAESEVRVHDAIRQIPNLTVVAIAHRLSLVAKFKRIILMEGGRITASGNHGELLANPTYARLWATQQLDQQPGNIENPAKMAEERERA